MFNLLFRFRFLSSALFLSHTLHREDTAAAVVCTRGFVHNVFAFLPRITRVDLCMLTYVRNLRLLGRRLARLCYLGVRFDSLYDRVVIWFGTE